VFLIEFSFHLVVILFALIAFASFVDAIAGGGGLITVPSYLAIGVPGHLVLGTNDKATLFL
tara:strand:- start:20 stop:202 length:183 start_codon:yes stop_codon:yes gene_type:complete